MANPISCTSIGMGIIWVILLSLIWCSPYSFTFFSTGSEPALFGTRKWKMLVAFKCLLEIQSRAAKIDAIGMFFYTEG